MKKLTLIIIFAFICMNFFSCTEDSYMNAAENAFLEYEYYEDTTTAEIYNYDMEYVSEILKSIETTSISTIAITTSAASTTTTTTAKTASTVSTAKTTVEKSESTGTSTAVSAEISTTVSEKSGKYVCIDVPYVSQRGEYPTGCELVSTSMLLQYYGFDVTAGDLIDGKYISCQDPEYKDNKAYFADPEKSFIGNPRTENGYGCYSPVIFNVLKKYLKDEYFDVVNLSEMSLDEICSLYIDFNQPVLIWASINMVKTNVKEDENWLIKGTKKKFKWIENEHCLVLVGYDDDFYYFNDPLRGAAVPYEKSVVEERYKELGFQAVTIHPW